MTVTATDPGSMSASTSFTITVSPAGGYSTAPSGHLQHHGGDDSELPRCFRRVSVE